MDDPIIRKALPAFSKKIICQNHVQSIEQLNILKSHKYSKMSIQCVSPNTEFFLVRIFRHSDWIRGDTPSECGKIRTRKKLRTWILFGSDSYLHWYFSFWYLLFKHILLRYFLFRYFCFDTSSSEGVVAICEVCISSKSKAIFKIWQRNWHGNFSFNKYWCSKRNTTFQLTLQYDMLFLKFFLWKINATTDYEQK